MAHADFESDLKGTFLNAAKYLESVTLKLDSNQLLEFYSYYKQAIQGKCNTARPSWYNMTARQKWDAWNGLGDLCQEEAMKKYISLLTQLFPQWEEDVNSTSPTAGWVAVSSMAKEEPDLADSDKKLSDWVREGNKSKVKQNVQNNIDQLDSEGLGPIHWAADRGNIDMLRFLVFDLKANIELKDQDGQTALHYAVSCGHTEIVKYLLDLGANATVKDNDGAMPLDIATESEIVSLLS